jgi:hypothetical protein
MSHENENNVDRNEETAKCNQDVTPSEDLTTRQALQVREGLSQFEQALASLRPYTGRLDAGWRTFLANEAARADSLRTDSEPGCASGEGHRFVCARCGDVLAIKQERRRWGWPTAFAGMTTVAAMLLVALVVEHSQHMAFHVASGPNSLPASASPALKLAPASSINTSTALGKVVKSDGYNVVACSEWEKGGMLAVGNNDSIDEIVSSKALARNDSSGVRKRSTNSTGGKVEESLPTNYELLRRLLSQQETNDKGV